MKKLKLALMGFGNVGQAFAEMLLEKHDEIVEKYERDVIVTVITTATKGKMYDPQGIDLVKTLKDLEKTGKFDENSVTDVIEEKLLAEADYDCLMELTPLDIFTGQPATDHIRCALGRGKHAITANKGPVAWYFSELRDLAESKRVGFFYETVVMDGTPVFNLVEHTLKMAKVTEVAGILNSTTNFILEEMEKGCAMDDIMDRGRKMGFIEADPAMDIEGYDAAGKVTALLNVLMDAGITPDQVDRKGIEDITIEDINDAKTRGNVIKLLCRGTFDENGNVIATVRPEEVPKTDMLASVNSTTSVISITTDLMKKNSIVEHEPEIAQTAYGVFGDMLRVIELES
ncbi:MAG: hypothetical protein PHS19_02885 [Eubacteriales bacterium]|nr:hypothetical protein [Eubacteriales bacterium]